MEIYIARIQRRDGAGPRMLAGVVETPREVQRRSSANIGEIYAFMGRDNALLKHKRKRDRKAR